mgnify:CR=1 FL=1
MIDTFKRNYLLIVFLGIASTWITGAIIISIIESGEFMKVGESKTNKVDVRIIAATNRDLSSGVREKNFRQDLYFRLKTVNI